MKIAIMTSPGTINAMYETPPTALICEPINDPKMRKYSIVVTTEGRNVVFHVRTDRLTSLLKIVRNAMYFCRGFIAFIYLFLDTLLQEGVLWLFLLEDRFFVSRLVR